MKKISLCLFIVLIYSYSKEITVDKINGIGQYKPQGEAKWSLIGETSVIQEGDQIRLSPKADLNVSINKTSTLQIKGGSVLRVKNLNDRNRLRVSTGKIRVQSKENSQALEIETRNAKLKITPNSDVLLDTSKKDSGVYVLKGKAFVNNIFGTGVEREVGPNNYSLVSKNASSSTLPRTIPKNVYLLWSLPVPEVKESTNQVAKEAKKQVAKKAKKERPKRPLFQWPKWKFGFDFNLNLGYLNGPDRPYTPFVETPAVLNGEEKWSHYMKVAFIPEFNLGPISFGLYLPAYMGFRDKFYEPLNYYNFEDYDSFIADSGANDLWNDIFSKFFYIQFQIWLIEVRVGGFNSLTFGSGFILNEYSNMLEFPTTRINGLKVAYDDDWLGIYLAYFMGNVTTTEIFGIRAEWNFLRTILMSENQLLNGLSLGWSYVREDNPVSPQLTNHSLSNIAGTSHSITGVGFDITQPILNTKLLGLISYLNMGWLEDLRDGNNRTVYGPGYSIGVKGNASLLRFKAEGYYNTLGFLPEYFDSFHQNIFNRADAYAKLLSTSREPNLGFRASLGLSLQEKLVFDVIYNDFFEASSGNRVNNKLQADFYLNKGVVKNFYFNFYYIKEGFEWDTLTDDLLSNAILGGEAHYNPVSFIDIIGRLYLNYDDNGKASPVFEFEVAFTFGGQTVKTKTDAATASEVASKAK